MHTLFLALRTLLNLDFGGTFDIAFLSVHISKRSEMSAVESALVFYEDEVLGILTFCSVHGTSLTAFSL